MMTPAALRDRLLFVEARLALAEDKLEIFKSQMRLALRALIGWGELVLFYLAVRLFIWYAPKLKGQK